MNNKNKMTDAQKIKQDIQQDLQSANTQGQQVGTSPLGSAFTNAQDVQKIKQDIQNDLNS